MFFVNDPRAKKTTLVIEIDATHVSASMMYIPEKEIFTAKPELFSVVREEFDMHTSLAKIGSYAHITRALKKALQTLIKKGFGAPLKVAVFFSSPWVTASLVSETYAPGKEFTMTDKLYEKIIGEVRQINENEEAIERKVLDLRMNGYEITDPIGKRGTSFACKVYISSVPKKLAAAVIAEVQTSYQNHEIPITAHTSPLALFVVARNIFTVKDPVMSFCVGKESTSVLIMREHVLSQVFSVPFGHGAVLRSVMESCGCSLNEAASYLRMYEDEMLDKRDAQKITTSIRAIQKKWFEACAEAWQKENTALLFPSVALLVAPPDYQAWFKDALSSDLFSTYTVLKSPVTVIPLTSAFFVPYVHTQMEDFSYATPKIAALFINSVQ